MKAIIFDASTLISFSMNGLLPELKELRKIFNGKFLITPEVKAEIIDNPIKIQRFELEALKLQQLVDDKILELPNCLEINSQEISKKTQEVMGIANKMFTKGKKNISIIHSGETSCLALSKILTEKKIKNVLAIDERTMRMLIEKPENLKSLLQKKLHTNVELNEKNFKPFKGFKIIRSTELIYIAFKKNLLRLKGKNVLDAVLYAMKFKGCAISTEEIQEIKRIK